MLLQNQEDTLNVNQVQFNQLLLDAHNHFQLREMNKAIKLYEEALNCQEAGRDSDRMAIILANLGIIYFHNCDYKQASTKLLEALTMLDKKNEFKCALMIKILGNLAIIKLITTDFQQCKDYNDQAIQLIYQVQPPFQYQLFKELMYIYFRFQSFESMGDGNFENLEQKYDGQSLACFYSSMGLNRELCGDMTLAMRYHQKALKLWQDLKENGFVVITLRRMITIAQNEKLEYKEYVALLQRCMQAPELKGISPEILFKDCDKKLQCAREITASLQKLEQHLNYVKHQALLSQPPPDQSKDEFWKLALRIRLKRAIQYCYHQMSQEVENADLLQQSITQLEHSIKLLDQQQPYENYLQNLPFTKESINIVKSHLIKFARLCSKIQAQPFFNFVYQVLNDKQWQPYSQKQNGQFFSQQSVQQQQYTQQFQSVTNRQLQDPLGSQYQSVTNNQLPEQQNQRNLKDQQFEQQRYQVPGYQQQQQQQMFDSKQQNFQTNQFNSGQFGSQQPIKQTMTQSQQQQQIKVAKSVSSQQQLKQSQTLVKSQKLKNTHLLDSAYRTAMMGDHLVKCHKSSNGRLDKFFLLANDNTFRWASKDKYINDPSKVSSYLVSDIRGIFYGKVTDVLRKSYNETLEPWLCFSLIMKTRSMDFYLQQHQINPWVFALSEEIKRRNPKGFVITPGVMLWRKMKFILHWHFVDKKKDKDKDKKKKSKKRITFIQLILMFGRNNSLLPSHK